MDGFVLRRTGGYNVREIPLEMDLDNFDQIGNDRFGMGLTTGEHYRGDDLVAFYLACQQFFGVNSVA